MKTVFLYTIFLLFSLSSFGQKIRFTDPTNFWHVKEQYYLGSSETDYYWDFSYGADTVIVGKTYKQFITSFPQNAFVREDTTANIVYYFNTGTFTEDTLYNYNLRLGDTIITHMGSFNFIDTVHKVDSILINGVYHKRFDILCANCNQYLSSRFYTVVEGIGSISGPVFPSFFTICYSGPEQYVYDLLCFSENSIAPTITIPHYFDCFGNGATLTNTSTCWPTGVDNLEGEINRVNVYPNPVRETLYVEIFRSALFLTQNDGDRIIISDITGRLVYDAISSERKIAVSTNNFASGVYFIELIHKDGTREVKKIIKE